MLLTKEQFQVMTLGIQAGGKAVKREMEVDLPAQYLGCFGNTKSQRFWNNGIHTFLKPPGWFEYAASHSHSHSPGYSN